MKVDLVGQEVISSKHAAPEIITATEHAITTTRQAALQHRNEQAAEQALKRELRTVLKKLNRHYGYATDSSPRNTLATIKNNFKHDMGSSALFYSGGASLYISPVLGHALFTFPPFASGALFAGLFISFCASAAVALSGTVFGYEILQQLQGRKIAKKSFAQILSPVTAPFRYAKRALLDRNPDPRLWKRNSRQLTNMVWNNIKTNHSPTTRFLNDQAAHFIAEYSKENRITPSMAADLAHYFIAPVFQPHNITRHRDEQDAVEALAKALLVDPSLSPRAISDSAQVQSHLLPAAAPDKSVTRTLTAQRPDMAQAEQQRVAALASLSPDNVTWEAVTIFGMAAQQEAETARAAIHSWQIHNHLELPPSFRTLDAIITGARALRPLVADATPLEKISRLRRLFGGDRESDAARLARIAGETMQRAATLQDQIRTDISQQGQAMKDQGKALDILTDHAQIIESYSTAFNDAAGPLKKMTAAESTSEKRVHFSADTINQTRDSLRLSAIRAQQDLLAHKMVAQPEQEYIMRTLPLMAARATDILKAIGETYRLARLRELAALQDNATADVRAYRALPDAQRQTLHDNAAAALDSVIHEWEPVLSAMQDAFALEDRTGKRLLIADMRTDKRGQPQAPHLKIDTL